jgi:hypothetical protein
MSRGDGSYHGEFTVDYTDYDIDYYSSLEGMGDNFDYMSKVGKNTTSTTPSTMTWWRTTSTTPTHNANKIFLDNLQDGIRNILLASLIYDSPTRSPTPPSNKL